MKYELSIVIPTFNESGNVIPLYKEIQKHLGETSYEVVFVDDNSLDGTIEQIYQLIETYPNVRLIRRVDKRGLSSACIEGFASSNSEYLAVIDADLQHDPAILALMLAKIKQENLDIIVGSRFLGKSDIQGLSKIREKLSMIGNAISGFITGAKLSDPLSGFFMVKKSLIDQVIKSLSGKGFKILLDIFSSCKLAKIRVKFGEVPIVFRKRNQGESKLDSLVMLEFLMVILDKLVGKYIPVRFVLFVMVGLSGLVLHMLIFTIMMQFMNLNFMPAQTLTTVIVMSSNFFINNAFTYRDKRLKGSKLIIGLLSFCLACSIGAFINVGISTFLYERGMMWLLAAFSGCVIGSIWNYGMTSFFTWKDNVR